LTFVQFGAEEMSLPGIRIRCMRSVVTWRRMRPFHHY